MHTHSMISANQFDRDYFEDGIRTRKSLYKNFRWMPWISFPIANAIKKLYPKACILDWGAGKGFTVHALRLMGVEAYGFDISDYALSNCKTDVAKFLYSEKSAIPDVDVIFIKDALEHLQYEDVTDELKWMTTKCKDACFIIPLGDNGEYRIPDYHFDVTHIIAEDEEWWAKHIIDSGFQIDEFYHHLPGFKDNWQSHHPYGNGVFLCSTKT